MDRRETGENILPERDYPTLSFTISPICNLFQYLEELTQKGAGRQTPFVGSLQSLNHLRNYSPGTGLWGVFEEALAASLEPGDLDEQLNSAAERINSAIKQLVAEALPEYGPQWQEMLGILERRRDEIVAAWYPREEALMKAIVDQFGTPWEGDDADIIQVSLIHATGHKAKSRPFILGVGEKTSNLVLCDIVHELLHRNSFGSAKTGLWSKLQLFYFTAGVPAPLGHEVTHTIITWGGCSITADIFDLDEEELFRGFYADTVSPTRASLDALAPIWAKYRAGEMKVLPFMQQAVESIRNAVDVLPLTQGAG